MTILETLKKRFNFSSALSVLLMGLSLLVMASWIMAPLPLVAWYEKRSTAPMRFNAALLLFLIAWCIWLMNTVPFTERTKRLITRVALAALVIGTATLAEHLFDVDLGIDDFFVNHSNATQGKYQGRTRFIPLMVIAASAASILLIIRQNFIIPFFLISTSLFIISLLIVGTLMISDFFHFGKEYTKISYLSGLIFTFLLISLILSRPLYAFNHSIQLKLSVYFLGASFALMVVFYTFYQNYQLQEKANEESAIDYQMLAKAQICNEAFVQLENYWRDYLVLKDSTHLTLYQKQIDSTRSAILALKHSGIAYSNISNAADSLLKLLALHNSGTVALAQMDSRTDRFQVFSQQNLYINKAIATLNQVEIERKDYEEASLRNLRQRNNLYMEVFLLFGGIAIIILITGVAMIISNLKKRAAAENKLRELNDSQEKEIARVTEEVKQKESHFETLVRNMNEGLQIIGFDWKYIYVNETVARRSHSMSAKDVVGRTLQQQFPGIESTDLFKKYEECMLERKTSSFEYNFKYANGTRKWFLISVEPVPEGILTITSDIDGLKASQKTLNDYKMALDVTAIITITDADGNITYVNRKFCESSGYSEHELIGKNHRIVNSGTHDNEYFKQLWGTIQAGNVWRGEVCNRNKDGSLTWFDAVIIPFLNEHNIPYQYMAIRTDITARKNIEQENEKIRKDLQKRAEELQRSNAELEQYAYAASHDLQEPSRMISNFTGLLQKKYADKLDSTAQTYIRYAKEGALRMRSLVLDMLEIGKLGQGDWKKEETDLNEVLKQALQQLKEQVKQQKGHVSFEKLPVVTCNARKLKLAFVHLIDNALKFRGKEDPVVHIAVQDKGDHWQFCVSDNGIGIQQEYYNEIFVIFQRLNRKEEFPGNGTGLALVNKVITLHNGQIWVESEPGKGSRFYFTLPKH